MTQDDALEGNPVHEPQQPVGQRSDRRVPGAVVQKRDLAKALLRSLHLDYNRGSLSLGKNKRSSARGESGLKQSANGVRKDGKQGRELGRQPGFEKRRNGVDKAREIRMSERTHVQTAFHLLVSKERLVSDLGQCRF
jgi:hypothetical protein